MCILPKPVVSNIPPPTSTVILIMEYALSSPSDIEDTEDTTLSPKA